jgi:hypothetical protein
MGDRTDHIASDSRLWAVDQFGLAPSKVSFSRMERRGRFAEGPSEIPARGWKDILLRVYNGISDDRILANAAGVTYYALLALFPGIAAIVSIYGLFADPSSIVSHVDTVAGFAPGGAVDMIRGQLTDPFVQPAEHDLGHQFSGWPGDLAVERERRDQGAF